MNNNKTGKKPVDSEGGKVLPALCSIIGTVILVSAVALLVPAAAPRLFGCETYDVVSASMEPKIPVGSMVLVKPADPAEVQEGDVIAYLSGEDVVTHRVTENRQVEGEFITKGDANATEDPMPVAYESMIGRVAFHVPALGMFLHLITGTLGKLYLVIYIVCGLLFHVLASRLRARGRDEDDG